MAVRLSSVVNGFNGGVIYRLRHRWVLL